MTTTVHHSIIVDDIGSCTAPRDISWAFEGTDGLMMVGCYAYICPVCLKVWATAKVDEWKVNQWDILVHPCPDHPTNAFHVAGSLIVPWGSFIRDPLLLASLPPELVHREFNLALAHWERYNKEEQNG